jgi:hypothetical protein
MPTPITLESEERAFFGMVERAAFSNPFGDERGDIDRRIVEAPDGWSRPRLLEVLVKRVAARVAALERAGRADIRLYGDADAGTLRTALLFHLFHHCIDDFDGLIQEQAGATESVVTAPFTRSLCEQLIGFGFNPDNAARYTALFYQMRRAFFFIGQSLIGETRSMQRVRERLWTNIFTGRIDWYDAFMCDRMEDFSTLILGGTGSGKGVAAAAIGRSGFIPYDAATHRFKENFVAAFVAVNLSEFSESLIESELFGHCKGAFTGAITPHTGVFGRGRACGAIFLDEIGEVNLALQTKLLRVMQERVFTPVGSHVPQRFSGRIIAATNQPLAQLRSEGRFRDDVYYRLCSDEICMPSLRTRLDESPNELERQVTHTLTRLCGERSGMALAPVIASLTRTVPADYTWPGNVRELEQAVRRILLGGAYTPQPPAAAPGDLTARTDLTARALVQAYCRRLYDRFGSYEEVARRADLDWRTVKKHLQGA